MNPHTILLIREGCGLVGLLLGCAVLYKSFHAGWFQITLKKPLDVRMSEPEQPDITLHDLLRARTATLSDPAKKGFQKNFQRHQ